MRKPVVDYSKFRLSEINKPQYSHLKLLWGWVVYFILFFLTESFVPQDRCYVVHCALDDVIAFREEFIIPYVLWYFFVALSLLYFLLYHPESFRKLMMFLIITQLCAMAIYIVFPNRQDLRPLVYPRDNFLTDVVKLLHKIDTDTNVCPSMHVAFSVAIASTWLKYKDASVLWKCFVVFFVILVCLAVSFIKQHSVIDTVAAFALCLIVEIIVYRKYWTGKFKKGM